MLGLSVCLILPCSVSLIVMADWAADQFGLEGGELILLCLFIHDRHFIHDSWYLSLLFYQCQWTSLPLSLSVMIGFHPSTSSVWQKRAWHCIFVFKNPSALAFTVSFCLFINFPTIFKPTHLPLHQHFSCIELTVWLLSNIVKCYLRKVSCHWKSRGHSQKAVKYVIREHGSTPAILSVV